MSRPRQLLPGSTYLLTRRTAGRQFLLRPDPFVRQAFGYVLAVAAQKFGVRVHCAVVLSDHYHAVVTDPNGSLPRFIAWVHRLTAVLVNMFRGRSEAVWNSSKPSVVRLETLEDILERLTYTFANPVAAGLVERASEWRGLATSPENLVAVEGEEFQRPDRFFDPEGKAPGRIRLTLSRPPGTEEMSDEQLVARVRGALALREQELASARRAAGQRCLGFSRAQRIPWTSRARTTEPRQACSPQIAARDPDVRRLALERLLTFRRDYHEALKRWRAGDRETRFPAGTYALRVLYGVSCHAPPDERLESSAA